MHGARKGQPWPQPDGSTWSPNTEVVRIGVPGDKRHTELLEPIVIQLMYVNPDYFVMGQESNNVLRVNLHVSPLSATLSTYISTEMDSVYCYSTTVQYYLTTALTNTGSRTVPNGIQNVTNRGSQTTFYRCLYFTKNYFFHLNGFL